MTLKKYNVTVRRFDPTQGPDAGEEFVLPVDCVDEEHAASAALSNLVAFTPKVGFTGVKPVAFVCTAVRERE